MNRPAHRPSQRSVALDAALAGLSASTSFSLDSVARACGMTKPGLMYHFPTKESLAVALIDHLIDRYESELNRRLSALETSPPHARLHVFIEWSITHVHDPSDLVMMSDPKLRPQLMARWTERVRPWIDVPSEVPVTQRARLHSARLLADGCWFSDALDIAPVSDAERAEVLAIALSLLEPPA